MSATEIKKPLWIPETLHGQLKAKAANLHKKLGKLAEEKLSELVPDASKVIVALPSPKTKGARRK